MKRIFLKRVFYLQILWILGGFLFLAAGVHAQSLAWQRSAHLKRGVNLSWLEYYPPGTALEEYLEQTLKKLPDRQKEMKLMRDLGFKTVRLPVTFDKWAAKEEPYQIPKEYFQFIDSLLQWSGENDLNLIIDNHHGSLDDSVNLEKEIPRFVEIWKQIAERYKDTDAEHVFFELYNEPHDLTNAQWMKVLSATLPEVRKILPGHTLIIGGTDWNSITGLLKMGELSDENILYTFHFYDPFLFTHQGATWAGKEATSNIHIPFPYDPSGMPPMNSQSEGTYGENNYRKYEQEGNKEFMKKTLQKAIDFSSQYDVPVFCGEFGSYKKYADPKSRARYTEVVVALFEELNIPYAFWEWDGSFSFFDGSPSEDHIPPEMKKAWGFKGE